MNLNYTDSNLFRHVRTTILLQAIVSLYITLLMRKVQHHVWCSYTNRKWISKYEAWVRFGDSFIFCKHQTRKCVKTCSSPLSVHAVRRFKHITKNVINTTDPRRTGNKKRSGVGNRKLCPCSKHRKETAYISLYINSPERYATPVIESSLYPITYIYKETEKAKKLCFLLSLRWRYSHYYIAEGGHRLMLSARLIAPISTVGRLNVNEGKGDLCWAGGADGRQNTWMEDYSSVPRMQSLWGTRRGALKREDRGRREDAGILVRYDPK